MTDLDAAFKGEDPEFMDRLFPDGDWHWMLDEMERADVPNWSWFWSRYCPHGFIITKRRDGTDKADSIMTAAAAGVIGLNPTATFKGGKSYRLYYWPYTKPYTSKYREEDYEV